MEGRVISEYDENLPKDLSVEDILVYSSNIGSVKIGQLVGQEKLKIFKTNWCLESIKF